MTRLFDREVQQDARLERVRVDGHTCGNHCGGIGRVAVHELRTGEPDLAHPVDAERAPVVAAGIEGDEVPRPLGEDESIRLAESIGDVVVRIGIGEAQAFGSRARERGRDQRVDVERGEIGASETDRHRSQRRDLLAQFDGEDAVELRQCRQRRRLDSLAPAGRGTAQSDRDRDGLVVVEHERRQVPARAEGVAAVRPGRPGNRVAETAQPGHVAPDGALGHLESLGELGGGPGGPGREQNQQPKQAGRCVHNP